MIILLIFSENSVSIINEEYVLFILFTLFDHVTLVMFRFLWNISFCFSNFSIVFFCFFAFTFWILISCIMISYDFFKIFIEFFITLIYCVWFFNSFFVFENAKNSIKLSLKNHFNFIVSLLFFSMIFLILFRSSTFVMFRNSFFFDFVVDFYRQFFLFFRRCHVTGGRMEWNSRSSLIKIKINWKGVFFSIEKGSFFEKGAKRLLFMRSACERVNRACEFEKIGVIRGKILLFFN